MSGYVSIRKCARLALVIATAPALSACVSFESKAPVAMLTLSAEAGVIAGSNISGQAQEALVVLAPQVPRKLDTNRIAVRIDAGTVAYLKDSIWADKPAMLVQQLLAETLSAKNGRLVLSEEETGSRAEKYLTGQLVEFGIDESRMEAVAIFDAVHIRKGSPIMKRRFEAREEMAKIQPREAGHALNIAANRLADEVAAWLAQTP